MKHGKKCVICYFCVSEKYPYTYIIVYMLNPHTNEEAEYQLSITSHLSDTNVVVTDNNSPFEKQLSMQGGESETVEVPTDMEDRPLDINYKMVIIRSDKFITIVSSNQKNPLDTSLVYPVTEWGQEYFVFTPLVTGYPKGASVFSGPDAISVTVELKCAATFQDKPYQSGDKLNIKLGAYEVRYFRSKEDCTGSRIVSDKPVGVISGHTCTFAKSKCWQMFNQLFPVEQWGTSYIVPPLDYQGLTDFVYILASKPTHVTYQFGAESQDIDLSAGQLKELSMGKSSPLVISSTQPIQVLYSCNCSKSSDGSEFGSFIMNIAPTDKSCQAYTLDGKEDFNNHALIVAKTKDIKEVQFDDKHPSFKWQQVLGTEYSWAHYTYEKGYHILLHPTAPIKVYSVGPANPAACVRK